MVDAWTVHFVQPFQVPLGSGSLGVQIVRYCDGTILHPESQMHQLPVNLNAPLRLRWWKNDCY